MHTVAILAYDGMTGFESGLAAEIFGMTELSPRFSAGITRPWYSVRLCAETPEVRMLGGANGAHVVRAGRAGRGGHGRHPERA